MVSETSWWTASMKSHLWCCRQMRGSLENGLSQWRHARAVGAIQNFHERTNEKERCLYGDSQSGGMLGVLTRNTEKSLRMKMSIARRDDDRRETITAA